MARLPQPGGDADQWGGILNDYLLHEHMPDGSHDVAALLQVPQADARVLVSSSATQKGFTWQSLTKSDVGLANVDNTSDLAKPVSNAAQSQFDTKVTKDSLVFNVKDYGAHGDGSVNDAPAINNAIVAANSAGGGVVYFPKGTYRADSRIVPKSNVTLEGVGNASCITRNANDQIIVLVNADLSWFTVRNIRFSGPVDEFPTVPKRARTTSGPGASFALYIRGNKDPSAVGAGAVNNICIEHCTFENMTELPVLIAGAEGIVRVINNNFINNKDPGFIFNEEVIFSNNHCMYSADNGVSLSRGNKKVTCTGNTIEGCAYEGIFIAGFDINNDGNLANIGPTNFTVTGNTIKNVGRNGIYVDGAPRRGVLAGNVIEQGYYRGPIDSAGTDVNSAGIYVAGYPFPYTAPTAFAEDIAVVGNAISRCARAGIEVWAAKRINLDSNLITDIGTQYKSDSATIASSDVTSNVGILIHAAHTTDVAVRNNTIIDSRTTPYCNYGIVPYTNVPATYTYTQNTMSGCRNAHNLINYDANAIYAMKGVTDLHANRVITITDNASLTPNFLNIQAGVEGQAVAFAAENFTGNPAPLVMRSKGAATLSVRPGADLIQAFQVRRSDGLAANSVLNVDTTNARIGINTLNPADALDVNGSIRSVHIVGTGAGPSSAAGVGAGTAPSLIVTGKDLAGKIVLTAGSSPAASAVAVSIVFTIPFANPPYVTLAPGNSLAAALTGTKSVFATVTTTGFELNTGTTALTTSDQYIWYYHVIA